MSPQPILTAADREHFLRNGYLKIPGCFTASQADEVTASLWKRLGITDATDKAEWDRMLSANPLDKAGRINMPSHRTFSTASFAPKAWRAIGELLAPSTDPLAATESLVSPSAATWNDGLIVNLGTPDTEQASKPEDLPGWHTDGDFFIHYLDSPEQALLVIPLFSDIRPGGGGTILCPNAIGAVARHLFEHPEGVSPLMTPRAMNPEFDPRAEVHGLDWFCDVVRTVANEEITAEEAGDRPAFVEVTGSVGDVFLLHPLMLHSASENILRDVRLITNPPVAIREPFCLQRHDGAYSLVEQVTLKALGREYGLGDWKITKERGEAIPERIRVQREARDMEKRRLLDGEKQKLSISGNVDVILQA